MGRDSNGELGAAVPAASSTLARALTNYKPGCLMSLLIKPVLNPLVNQSTYWIIIQFYAQLRRCNVYYRGIAVPASHTNSQPAITSSVLCVHCYLATRFRFCLLGCSIKQAETMGSGRGPKQFTPTIETIQQRQSLDDGQCVLLAICMLELSYRDQRFVIDENILNNIGKS